MTDYASLIERLEKADGPDREIDRDLWEAITGECTHRKTHFVYLENDERELECSDCGADTYGKDKWSGLTSSLDAALGLVERKLPGWVWKLSTDGDASAPDHRHRWPPEGQGHMSYRWWREQLGWAVHNVIAHPLSELLFWCGLRSWGDKLHDATIPPHEPGTGRG